MRSFCTKDEPTNANLTHLESLARTWPGIGVEAFMDKVRGVIGVQKMLPKAVLRHFEFPFLFIGDSAYRWTPVELEKRARDLADAINVGLERVAADGSLAKDGDADLSDRLPTKGEEIKTALKAYREYPGPSELSILRSALYGTSLHRFMERLDKWLARKRPSPGGRSIEYEIALVLGDIARRADDYHHEEASYRFSNGRGRSAQ